ncbi:MAG: DUF433 domain-containing protein [Fuerstia sp.]|nr:DUF433 domain-containing protein [Fuerstiella sp.]
MILTTPNYVEQTPEGVWKVYGSRVSLDSVLAAYLSGLSPEGIQEAFPSLSLEAIHGCLAFYLRNRSDLDAYLQRERDNFEAQRRAMAVTNQPVIERLRVARASASVAAAES